MIEAYRATRSNPEDWARDEGDYGYEMPAAELNEYFDCPRRMQEIRDGLPREAPAAPQLML